MNRYLQLKRSHHDCQLEVYIYAFTYVDPETMPAEDYFLLQKRLLITTKKCQLQDQYQIIGSDLVTYVHNIMS